MLKHQKMTAEQYLAQVEPAMRHLFDGIESYLERYRRIHWPTQARNSEELALGMRELEEWFAGQFSLSVLCGAVLLIADQVIDACSRNTTIPPACASFAAAESARFCVGRDVHGLPLGTIIRAGRHQFAHWQEEHEWDSDDKRPAGFNPFVQGVFDQLRRVHESNSLSDLVYDLGNDFYRSPSAIRADSLLLTEMGWTTYDGYVADMRNMLGIADGR
jgi:hypothetical protein